MKTELRNMVMAAMLIAAAALGAIGSSVLAVQDSSSEDQPIVLEELVRQDLATMEGQEAVVLRATFEPEAAMNAGETIEHPAEEFVYVLDGTARLTREGESPIEFGSGESWYNDLRRAHTLENASSTEPLQVLAVWIGEQGQI